MNSFARLRCENFVMFVSSMNHTTIKIMIDTTKIIVVETNKIIRLTHLLRLLLLRILVTVMEFQKSDGEDLYESSVLIEFS